MMGHLKMMMVRDEEGVPAFGTLVSVFCAFYAVYMQLLSQLLNCIDREETGRRQEPKIADSL